MTVFMSYSRGDAQQADEWVANLEQFGYRVWIDRPASAAASNGMQRSCAR